MSDPLSPEQALSPHEAAEGRQRVALAVHESNVRALCVQCMVENGLDLPNWCPARAETCPHALPWPHVIDLDSPA